MSDSDKFDFDSLMDEEIPDSGDDFFLFDSEPDNKNNNDNADIDSFDEEIPPDDDIAGTDYSAQKRTSADFSPDMDALLLTAQSSMIIEAMKCISQHDFRSKNITVFTEAIKGIDLYMKILERNPENFKKLTAILSSDQDCMDVQNITFNLYRNVTGELPQSDSQKLKAFEIIKEKLKNAYNKSLITSSIVSIKKFYLLSGSIDMMKIDDALNSDPDGLKNQINTFMKHINIGRQMIKSGNAEIVKGMKGKELNVFIVKAAQLLVYYFGRTGDAEHQLFYSKLHENFKKYFVIR
jgi:hypothetical protein